MIYDGLRGQITFASSRDPYQWALCLDTACRELPCGSGVTSGFSLPQAAQPARFASEHRS